MTTPVVVLLRRDLRLDDNPALAFATTAARPLVLLYVLDPATAPGSAARWWLHHSLTAFNRSIGGRLVLRRGDETAVVEHVVREVGAGAVHWNRRYEPSAVAHDKALKSKLTASGIEVVSHPGGLLAEPWTIATALGTPFKVFTPFFAALMSRAPFAKVIPSPGAMRWCESPLASESLKDWYLVPKKPNWAAGFETAWVPGEESARRALLDFIDEAMEPYASSRDRPDKRGTSRLSPHLAFGEISARRLWNTIAAHRPGAGRDGFLRQLVWREFSAHLLFHFPDLASRPFRQAFERFPWSTNAEHVRAWQRGRTGYPIVDAGMRELWTTGWMHNRVRMIAASFLTKHLRIDWRVGAAWFLDTLVDADLANNAAGWQWVAGSGTDAAPYFRIFNPTLQGQKFDPDGAYVRRWVPELIDVPASMIHKPWTAMSSVQGYPPPMVDHATARAEALAALKSVNPGNSGSE